MLLEDDVAYLLYVNYHFNIVREQSLTPVYSGNKISFPYKVKITKKKLNILQKLRYYFYDFLLFLRRGQIVYD